MAGPAQPAIGPAPGRSVGRLLLVLPVVAFGAVAALFAVRLGAGDPAQLPSALLGREVPSFSLPPVGSGVGPGLAAADLKGGGVTVVNVWASWCAPCRLEHPLLAELARSGTRLVGIDYKDNPDAASRFLAGLGNPFAAVGDDRSGRVGIDWGVYGVPETFVVDGAGRIRFKQTGPLTEETLPSLRAAIAAAAVPASR